jgi:hypothetical protein
MDNEKLRQELADLRARIKPQAEWTSFQDRLDQRSIEQRIRMIENHLEHTPTPDRRGD